MISGFNVVQIFYGAPGRRFLSLCTAPLLTAYDVKKFADPVTDLEEVSIIYICLLKVFFCSLWLTFFFV